MVRLLLSLAALAVMFIAPPAAWSQSNDSWISLAVESLQPTSRNARIDVSRTKGRSKAVRLAVRDGSIIIDRVVITYANGQVHFGDLEKPITLRSGQSSDPFDLRIEERFIDIVDVVYRIEGRQTGSPRIEVQGLQSPAGRLAERAVKTPPTVALGKPAVKNAESEAARQAQLRQQQEAERQQQLRQQEERARQQQEAAARQRQDRGISGSRGSGDGASATAERKEAPPQAPPPTARSRSVAPSKNDAPRDATSAPVGGTSADKRPYATVDIYFGTDRKREQDRQKWERKLATFGTQSDKRLTLGKAVITVPKEGRERGQITRPEFDILVAKFSLRSEDLARDFTIFGVDVLDQRTWLAAVQKQREQSRRFKDQALIFVHGFNVSFDDALFRAAQISYDLEFDGVPLVFSWPSVAGLTGYVLDRNRARNAQEYLRQFIELVEKDSGAKEIHLVAHSMGADPLLGALRDMALATPPGSRPGKSRFNEVILAAPDVTRDNFEQIAEKIAGLRKGMTLYASSNDRALQASGILTLGEFPAGGVPSSGPLVMVGLDTIDVSRANTDFFSLNHSTFADRAQLLTDMRGLLEKGTRPPNIRLKAYREVTISGGKYWRFEP